MEATVHSVLGKERIEQICAEHGLNDDDRQVVDKILGTWEGLSDFHRDMQAIRATGGEPHGDQILAAMVQIREEVARASKQ